MTKKERKDRLLALIKSKGYVSLEEIAKDLDMSESTVRRDIVEMDKEGLLVRERGGASSIKTAAFFLADQKLVVRERMNAENKLLIAKRAINLIRPDSTIYIDAGSSTLTLANNLPTDLRITVVTNSLSIARTVSEKGINTYLIGGALKITTDATVGPMAEEEISKFHFKQAFMGANAVDKFYGFMTPDYAEANFKKKAIQMAEETIFLIDGSKFNTKSVVTFAPSKGAKVITDFIDTKEEFTDLILLEVNQNDN